MSDREVLEGSDVDEGRATFDEATHLGDAEFVE
jgi:hypothetical protein